MRSNQSSPDLPEIRIGDAHTKALVEAERVRRRDGSLTRTARTMIQERSAVLRHVRGEEEAEAARNPNRSPDAGSAV